ncbi:hypothetical protein FBUS_01039 [Fasciolopsis buskii]|uniref:ZP domain-containing protein n=1 Tax=Fasciolopsis buskii TaxID=27845 RepID=A0A8E0RUH9_9TREM|nr:hypothetical protein FBUS_01039 [Fasciolopsis buski]
MNQQNSGAVGCLCPHDRAPGISNRPIGSDESHGIPSFTGSDVGTDSCTESLAEVSCFRNHLEVCYRPPTLPPYNRLSSDLADHKAFAFVTDARPYLIFDDKCVLTPTTARQRFSLPANPSTNRNESLKEDVLWCLSLDWRNDPGRQPCAVRVTEYMSGHLYSGYLAIVMNTEYQSPMRNLLFHFTCKTNNEIPQQVPGQVFERCPTRVLPGIVTSGRETRPSPLAGLLESPTRFETELFPVSHDASTQIFCPTGEDCSRHQVNYSGHESTMRRSSDFSADRSGPIQPVGLNTNTQNRHTRPVEYKVYRLQFRCVIRLCIERAWCCWPVVCGSRQGESLTPRTSFQPPSMRFVTRTVHLNVLQLVTAAQEPARTKSRDEQCTNFICATGLHTLLLIGLVGLLTCVMGIVGLILARRYQHRYDRSNYNSHNHYIAPKPIIAQTYRPPTVQPDLLTSPTTGNKIRSTGITETSGNSLPAHADTNMWLTLHAYTNAQLADTLPLPDRRLADRSHNHTPTFLTSPRCSCSETGGHTVSANMGTVSRLPVGYTTSSGPVHLTSFLSEQQERKSEQPLLFTPTGDSSTSSLKGVTYLQLTEPDQLLNPEDRSTPNEVTWTSWPGNARATNDCNTVPLKEYPYMMVARGVPPGGESSSAYSTFDRHETCART